MMANGGGLIIRRGDALILRLPRRLDLHCAFAGDMRPNPPRAFSLSHPDD